MNQIKHQWTNEWYSSYIINCPSIRWKQDEFYKFHDIIRHLWKNDGDQFQFLFINMKNKLRGEALELVYLRNSVTPIKIKHIIEIQDFLV